MPPSQPLLWLWQDDHFEPHTTIPAFDRGFRYGMSLFESLRLRDGKMHFASAHWARLQVAAQRCQFPLPTAVFPEIPSLLHELKGDWFIRLYITAGDGAPTDPVLSPRILLFAEARHRNVTNPHRIAFSAPPFSQLFEGTKTGNYWANISALSEALRQGATEALLFNSEARLVSASMANVFLRIQGQWMTPPLSTGARNGVIRSWVLEQIPAVESLLSKEDLHLADAGFLTNSWMGIGPVAALENRDLELSPTIQALQERLEALSAH